MVQMGGVSTHLTSLALWTILPSLLTDVVLRGFYLLFPLQRPTLPVNATPPQIAYENARAQEHHRRARIVLILSYLIYTLGSIYYEQSSGPSQNYYSLLGITRDQVELGGSSFVKSHFRKLARLLHPDKVGKQGEPLFIAIKQGSLVLQDEGALRWGYEKFGPGVLDWQPKAVTFRDFMVRGAQSAVGFYVVALGSIFLISFFRKNERAYNYWRYLFLLLTLSLEFYIILRTSLGQSITHPILSFLLPSRLPYQQIEFLRQLFISSSMALSHLSPLLTTPSPIPEGSTIEEILTLRAYQDAEILRPYLQRLTNSLNVLRQETKLGQLSELRPFVRVDMKKPEFDEVMIELVKKREDAIRSVKVKVGEGTREAWKGAFQREVEKERQLAGQSKKIGVAQKGKTGDEKVSVKENRQSVQVSSIAGSAEVMNGPPTTLADAILRPIVAEGGESEAAKILRARLLSPPPESN